MLRQRRRHLECHRLCSVTAIALLLWSVSRVVFHVVNLPVPMQSSAFQPLAMESNNFSYGFQLRSCFTYHNIRSLRYQYTCRKCSRHSPLTILILLLMCGDIESNPGPNTPQTYTCGICDRKVGWEDKGVACDNCNIWFHCSCTVMTENLNII